MGSLYERVEYLFPTNDTVYLVVGDMAKSVTTHI